MSKVSILDCTLRDGGYINKWTFGDDVIRNIIAKLIGAGIDIIECGFMRDVPYSKGTSVFSAVKQITPFITPKCQNTIYVGMLALGDIAIEKIEPYDGTSLDGIRLSFHKHQWKEAKSAIASLIQKGYKVFVQPVGTTSYTDAELLQLIAEVNSLNPFAFYLVDTLGILFRKDLLRMYYLVDNNLNPGIRIGFHSHNNLQLSFANAQELLLLNSTREIIIDASVYGMGRGAGNLSTELLAEYINVNIEQKYAIIPILDIADKYLLSIYADQRWGYALPYFISAIEKCHPNYASYLLDKETLSIESISKILSLIPQDKRDLYYLEEIESLYLSIQNSTIDDAQTVDSIRKMLSEKSVLILAPGATIVTESEKIDAYVSQNHPCIISINFVPKNIFTDILFVSNQKRLDVLQIAEQKNIPAIISSNLQTLYPKSEYIVNYTSYIGEGNAADNATAMLIRVLIKAGVKSFVFAGLDGYSVNSASNYSIDSYQKEVDRKMVERKNREISKQIKSALGNSSYKFLTSTRYEL